MKQIGIIRAGMLLSLFLGSGYQQAHGQLPTKAVLDDARVGARSHNIDQLRMVVRVSFEPEKGLVHGRVTHFFTPLRSRIDSVYLDGPEIRYEEVRLNGRAVPYRVWPEGISIYPETPRTWGQVDTLDIAYEATPRHGMYFTGWNGGERKQIWTQGQGPGHRHWVPVYDYPNDRLVTETIVTFDQEYEVLSNGERVSVTDNPDGTRTWHYRMAAPHAPYLMMLGIGKYAADTVYSSRGTPIANYYYPDRPDQAEPTYRHTAALFDALETETEIPYPWGRYANLPVRDFLHGGMENTTATIYTDTYMVDERAFLDQNYVTVNAHEMAHQWFGNLVTQGRNEDIWLHESFATHYAKMAEKAVFGEDHYQWNRKIERDRALSNPGQGPVPIRSTLAGSDLVYYKGSLVLDMLREVTGKPEYDRAIAYYLRRNLFGNVTGPDFFNTFDQALGMNLDWFFDQWILRGGEPHYEVSYDSTLGATEIRVRQIQETGPLRGYFRMPIIVEVHYRDGSAAGRRAMVDSALTLIRIPNPQDKPVEYVLFDPNHTVLKRLTFERTMEELAAQALKADNMIDRYDAVEAMRSLPVEAKRDALTGVFRQESFPMIRAEAVRQLAVDEESAPLLAAALRDGSADVRRAALESAVSVTPHLKAGFEKALRDSSYRNIRTALIRLAAEHPEGVGRYLEATRHVVGHEHNVRIAWLETAARSGLAAAADSLVALAAPSYDMRTRAAAFYALERLGLFNDRIASYLLDALTYFNRRMREPAAEVLGRARETHRAILERAFAAGSWTEGQRRTLEAYLGG